MATVNKTAKICEWRDCKSWSKICKTIPCIDYKIINIPDSDHNGNAIIVLEIDHDFQKIHESFLASERICCIVKSEMPNLFGRNESVIFHESFIKRIVISDWGGKYLDLQLSFPFYDIIG